MSFLLPIGAAVGTIFLGAAQGVPVSQIPGASIDFYFNRVAAVVGSDSMTLSYWDSLELPGVPFTFDSMIRGGLVLTAAALVSSITVFFLGLVGMKTNQKLPYLLATVCAFLVILFGSIGLGIHRKYVEDLLENAGSPESPDNGPGFALQIVGILIHIPIVAIALMLASKASGDSPSKA
ncbi:hypothetical protein CAOG_06255 [Capsaspora owczarzaki ATCC 30864]|uniref:Uncharacterized protein n=1 Tax=Capsaspora owczarzaki (strain ATCC 30864) TaxID=595528 RepID=A0A0D2VWC1_CAPO3|nr:hypothetical protein CAOG_06255 [Capsaspora owczarzaki ATCC 30864]KJE95852.1 hypothetical protein CAOG_006255 [Capsaspora owczarzaki ATCC 30864]|eukprot:XP_004345004.2 hypothetical protein CAOG_06255 [Capsaspora owczarzaki ATCC 30864]